MEYTSSALDPQFYDDELKKFLAEYESGNLKSKQPPRPDYRTYKMNFQLQTIRARLYYSRQTQKDVAQKLQVSQSSISKIENGNPTLEHLIIYLYALGYKLKIEPLPKQ